MTVIEYKREFVRLSKYTRECLSTKTIVCKRFENGLNEDIQLLVGILELKEFVELVERECKAEELAKKTWKADLVSQDLKKRQLNKSFQSSSKNSREFTTRSNASSGYSSKNRSKQYTVSKAQTTSIASVWNARPDRSGCPQRGRHHFGECQGNDRTCFKCSSLDHFVKDCPERTERRNLQGTRLDSTANKGKPQRNPSSGTSSKAAPRDSTVRPEGRAPTRTYAIRPCEEASSPDVITGTFSIYETPIVPLIDLGSTHSYICMKLVSGMNLFVEPTEFANLLLLPFDEFDVILGMNWLTTHDVVVNFGRKFIELKYESGNVFWVEQDELNGMPAMIFSMSTQRCIRKAYEAYLTFVLNTKESELKIELVPVVCEYSNLFLEESSGLPPIREVEFGIDLTPGTTPISIAPYRMAPIELKELKVQL
ncbi:uncharacterized protein [Gossypium hirsutum]|uniref:CCHC-type domain-containing protein n=1 Tax=Gossypium hirsutum TaxID=3635 RepID=A0A1U8HTT8_GOSHI|nr:uncharacterized protein LOC107887635 [Gossypium hirsutum]